MKAPRNDSIEGHAALSICESMLIAMHDLKIMSQSDARNVLKDAATAHTEASGQALYSEMHKEVAALINNILANGNSLPRL